MKAFGLWVVLGALCALAQTPCACNADNPETLKDRQCSLCNEAERHPPDVKTFFLRDANPRKPNRMLLLPRYHGPGLHRMAELNGEQRLEIWSAAIAKAKELWGDKWAVAYNGDAVRTQCHLHIHIGRMLPGVEAGDFIEVSSAAQIPAPAGDGLWVHPAGDGRLHVHTGEQITETVLLR